jgi:hypothetical protein
MPSPSNPDNAQKLNFAASMDRFFAGRYDASKSLRGQALPAEVVSIDATGTIVTVKFPMQDPGGSDDLQEQFPLHVLELPQMEMPVATDLYGIPPLQEGDQGYCVPADYSIDGVAGYSNDPTSFTPQPNLSTLVFHPIGNVQAGEREHKDKYFLSGPTGVHLFSLEGEVSVKIGPLPEEEGPKNAMQIKPLIQASSDLDAKQKGVPLYGLYHNAGTVRYQYTVP